MARWHALSCGAPRVEVGGDSVPSCQACGNSAHQLLRDLTEHPSSPAPSPPPDEPPGKLNLSWPSTVTYTRTKSHRCGFESGETESLACFKLSEGTCRLDDSSSRRQTPHAHDRALGTDEFRLIRLVAKENEPPEDVIHLLLETYSDRKFPEYEAVSYTWGGEDGDATLRHPVYVGEYWDILPQTRNCCAMLRYLRPSRGERVVWVDAICINQKDSKERGEQVAKMGRIYSQCFQVVLWLGDDLAFKPSKAFATRHSFHELESLEILMPTIKGSTTPLNRLTIQKLLERRYFSRAWVLQELILAARVIIPIGDMVFSVDPLMTEHLNQLTGYNWSWEQTRAPWFQHATRGLLLPKSMFELLRLAWESRSSDVRDKFYAVWGPYTLEPNGIQIQPDYSISLQHLATGFFAHSIINEGASQLLLKASGAYAEVGIPSWMPNCKDPVTWEKLFGNEGEETPSWDQMERIVSISQDSKKDAYFRFTTSPPTEADAPKTMGRRLWYQDATVDADSGAMTLNLTKLFTIGGFKRANGDKGLTWYQFTCMKADLYPGSILLASRSKLDTTVEVEDEVYLFDNNTTEPIYLVLRPTGNQLEFKLIAACPYCVCTFPNNEFFHSSGDHRQGPKVGTIPITDLQQSLYTDLMRLHNCLEQTTANGFIRDDLIPGMQPTSQLKELFPLVLGLVNDAFRDKFKSWGTFGGAYLNVVRPYCRWAEISNGRITVSLGKEFQNLQSSRYGDVMQGQGWWKRTPGQFKPGEGVVSYHLEDIKQRLFRPSPDYPWVIEFLLGLQGSDVGDRIMDPPKEEDHFRKASFGGRHRVFEGLQLDGRTFPVRIV